MNATDELRRAQIRKRWSKDTMRSITKTKRIYPLKHILYVFRLNTIMRLRVCWAHMQLFAFRIYWHFRPPSRWANDSVVHHSRRPVNKELPQQVPHPKNCVSVRVKTNLRPSSAVIIDGTETGAALDLLAETHYKNKLQQKDSNAEN